MHETILVLLYDTMMFSGHNEWNKNACNYIFLYLTLNAYFSRTDFEDKI